MAIQKIGHQNKTIEVIYIRTSPHCNTLPLHMHEYDTAHFQYNYAIILTLFYVYAEEDVLFEHGTELYTIRTSILSQSDIKESKPPANLIENSIDKMCPSYTMD